MSFDLYVWKGPIVRTGEDAGRLLDRAFPEDAGVDETTSPRRGAASGASRRRTSRESKEPALADRLFGITLGERSAGELELVPLLVAENRLDPVLDGLGVDAEAEVLAAAPGVQAERRDRDDDVGVGRIEDRTT